MSPWDPPQGVTEPHFFISPEELGHVRPHLGYLAKWAKCRVHFLGHGMSNSDATWYVGGDRWVMHDGKFFPNSRSRSRSRESENSWRSDSCQIWPHAKSIGSDRINESDWRFLYSESWRSPGCNGAGIFDFVPEARSRDTEFKLFDQIRGM